MLNDLLPDDVLSIRVVEEAADEPVWLPVDDNATEFEYDIQIKLLRVRARTEFLLRWAQRNRAYDA